MRLESWATQSLFRAAVLDVIFPVNLSTFLASHIPIRNKSQMNDSYTYPTQRSNHVCGIAIQSLSHGSPIYLAGRDQESQV